MRIKKYDGTILNNTANVLDFGAVGDGVTDDTTAIQAALDDKQTDGGTIYFPAGVYKVTASLLFYSNQQLIFEPGATILQGAAIDNLLMTYCGSTVTGYNGTHDSVVYGATFDGSTYEENNTLVGTVHAKNITFEKCIFKNAYGSWHNLEINSTYNAKVIDCEFEGSRKTSSYGCLIQLDAIANSNTWPWPTNIGVIDSTPSKHVEICGCLFRDCSYAPAIGNHSTDSALDIKVHDNIFTAITSSRGAINFYNATDVLVANNVFENCSTGIGSGSAASKYYVSDNQFIGTTPTADESIQSDNMVDGVMSAGYVVNALGDWLTDLAVLGDYPLTVADIEAGTWSYSTKGTNSKRLRVKKLIPIKGGSVATYTNPSFKVYFGTLATKTASSYSNASGWLSAAQTGATYTLPNDGYLAIIFETADGSEASVSDYDCTVSISIPSISAQDQAAIVQDVVTDISPTMQTKAITDTGGYYTTDTVEGALQEIGAEIAGVNTLIGTGVIS